MVPGKRCMLALPVLPGPLVALSRVYRWYRVFQRLEQQMDASGDAASLEQVGKELERVGEEIRRTHVPARYGANLFALRAHHRLLLDRLVSLEKQASDG